MEVDAKTQGDKNPMNTVTGVKMTAVIKTEEESTTRRSEREKEEEEELDDKEKDWVIDVKRSALSSSGEKKSSNERGERECRICHLNTEEGGNCENLIELGCGCRGELGVSHLRCAQTWFKLKGNRMCEICGTQARNVTDVENNSRISMLEWDTVRLMSLRRRRMMATTLPEEEEDFGLCGQRFFNVLLVCIVLAFVIPWLFRMSML